MQLQRADFNIHCGPSVAGYDPCGSRWKSVRGVGGSNFLCKFQHTISVCFCHLFLILICFCLFVCLYKIHVLLCLMGGNYYYYFYFSIAESDKFFPFFLGGLWMKVGIVCIFTLGQFVCSPGVLLFFFQSKKTQITKTGRKTNNLWTLISDL